MKVLAYLLAIILITVLQTGFFGFMRPLGVMPNLMIVAIIIAGLRFSATFTLALAIGGGLLLDITSGSDFGLRMAFYTTLALALIIIRQLGFHLESWWVMAGVAALATLIFDLAIIASVDTQMPVSDFSRLTWLITAEIIINSLGVVLVQAGLLLAGNWLSRPKREVHSREKR